MISKYEKEGLIYILRVDDEIKKIGSTQDIKKIINLYKVGKIHELLIVLVYKTKNITVEKCVKKNANNDDDFIKETIIYCNKTSKKSSKK